MKKKWVVILCLLVFGIAVLMAGGQKDSASRTGTTGNIVWSGWSGEEEASREIFNWMRSSWEEKNPGKSVTWVGWPWAETATQLVIRNQGSEKMDIAQVDIGIFATVGSTGALADWTDILGVDYIKSNFEPASLAVGNLNGKQLGLPWSIASIGMIYNPEILAQAGYDVPPATIEEFEACLEAISKLPGDIIPYGIATKDATAANDFMPWIWTFGGSVYADDGSVALNGPEGIAAFSWYKSLIDRNYIRTNMSRFDARQLFAQGRIAFYDDAILAKGIALGNGIAADKLDNVARPMVRPVLTKGDTPQSMMWGHMLVMFDKSTEKETAADFARHLVGPEVALRYFESNGMPPVLKSVLASQEVQSDPWLNNWNKITATGRLGEFDLSPSKGQLTTILTEELQATLVGSKTPAAAVKSAADRIASVR